MKEKMDCLIDIFYNSGHTPTLPEKALHGPGRRCQDKIPLWPLFLGQIIAPADYKHCYIVGGHAFMAEALKSVRQTGCFAP